MFLAATLTLTLALTAAVQEPSPTEAERLYRLGQQSLLAGRLEEAESAFLKALSLRPDFTEATLGLAEIALLRGRAEEAISRLEPTARAAPSPRAHLLLARAWASMDANRSLPWLQKVFDESPGSQEAWELWVDILTAAGRFDEAISRLERHVESHPGFAHLHLLLAQLYVNRGALAKAETQFREVERLAPQDSELKKRTLYSLGYLYATMGRIEEGARLLRQALDRDAAYVPALTALSDLLVKTGNADEAGALLARARQLQPEEPEVLVLLGQYHLKRKEWNEAAAVLADALKRHPGNVQAHFFLAQALKEQGNLVKAAEHFRIFDELKKKARAEAANRHRGLAVEGVK